MVFGMIALVASLAGLANTMTTASLTCTVAPVTMETGLNFKDMQKSLNSLAKMVLDHHLALNSY
jgi:hypothetical protein